MCKTLLPGDFLGRMSASELKSYIRKFVSGVDPDQPAQCLKWICTSRATVTESTHETSIQKLEIA